MATVAITYFPSLKYCSYKMDADHTETPRDYLSRREKRWSMNSQRLEEIVAELMKPISDATRSFDTDLSSLLEEYLTEAGLHALDADDSEMDEPTYSRGSVPNFIELALLLQQSASIYGRKVDFLYNHVLAVSDSLQSSILEDSQVLDDAADTPSSSRRKRKASVNVDFTSIELESSASSRREVVMRPPPTLPRAFVELEPRTVGDRDRPLTDYQGEEIGLISDYHVSWTLQNGLLVDSLASSESKRAFRGVPLSELQAALEAAAAAERAPLPAHSHTPPASPAPPSSPAPHAPPHSPGPLEPPACSTPLPGHRDIVDIILDKKQRKRKSDTKVAELITGTFRLVLTKEARRLLSARGPAEFTVEASWRRRVLAARRTALRRARRAAATADHCGFAGFAVVVEETTTTEGVAEEATAAVAAAAVTAGGKPAAAESDDDGFFDGSLSGSDCPDLAGENNVSSCRLSCEWAVGVAATAAARGAALDVAALARGVLRHTPATATPFSRVLAASARRPPDVARVLLATLFLANSGHVEISKNEPLALGQFCVRAVSRDLSALDAFRDEAAAPSDPTPTDPAPTPASEPDAHN